MKFFSQEKGAKLLFSLSILLLFSTNIFAQFNDTNFQQKINSYPTNDVTSVTEADKSAKKGISIQELERKAFELLNQRRIENGLQPVIWSDEVAKVARIHSQNMAKNNFFSHQGLDGLMVDKRADSFGLKNWRRIGENIAYNRGYANPVEYAVLRWMQSESHRENLLSNKWKESGVGVAIAPDGKTYYFTQVFILRK